MAADTTALILHPALATGGFLLLSSAYTTTLAVPNNIQWKLGQIQ